MKYLFSKLNTNSKAFKKIYFLHLDLKSLEFSKMASRIISRSFKNLNSMIRLGTSNKSLILPRNIPALASINVNSRAFSALTIPLQQQSQSKFTFYLTSFTWNNKVFLFFTF